MVICADNVYDSNAGMRRFSKWDDNTGEGPKAEDRVQGAPAMDLPWR